MKHEEKTLVLIKPDALQRNLLGEVIHRFERKGLKIVGLKMLQLQDALLDEHYAHHKDKSFFEELKRFMKSAPVVAAVLEGFDAVRTVRQMCGKTFSHEAEPGTIRGDFSISPGSANIVHASDSIEVAEIELKRFFPAKEIFDYEKIDSSVLYGEGGK